MLIFNKSPAVSLKISNKPIIDSEHRVSTLNVVELKQAFSFDYYENVKTLINVKPSKKLFRNKDELTEKVLDRIQNPLNDSLITCYIDEKVGYGVFTTMPIEAGAVIGLYAGELMNQELLIQRSLASGQLSDYSVSLNNSLSIDAVSGGGVTRFIQHMPFHPLTIYEQIEVADNTELKKLLAAFNLYVATDDYLAKNFDSIKLGLKQRIDEVYQEEKEVNVNTEAMLNAGLPIALANTRWDTFTFEGHVFSCIVAIRCINENEQLGVDYGSAFWKSRGISCQYFHKDTGYVLPLPELKNAGFFKQLNQNSHKEKELRNAANRGQINLVSKLISENVDVNAPSPSNGKTPLHYATLGKHCLIVSLLLKAGAELIVDCDGKSPKDYAEEMSDEKLISLFSNLKNTAKKT